MSRADAPNLVHPTVRLEGGGLARLVNFGALGLALAVSLAILLHFHNRFWWAQGEGAAAMAALDLLNGDGAAGNASLVDFMNALAFKAFGVDLVSLRYPLVALTLLQTGLAFVLLVGRGVLLAFAAALTMTCLTFIQFLSPVPEWYAVFLCLLIIGVLSAGRFEARGDVEAVGFLLAVMFLVLPAAGAIAAAGVLAFLFLRELRPADRERAMVARGFLFLIFAGLAIYLRTAADLVSALMFGTVPLMLLGYAFLTAGIGDRAACRLLGRLCLGALLVLVPFVCFHAFRGTLEAWLLQVVGAVTPEAMAGPGVGAMLFDALQQIIGGGGPAAILNGIFWLALPLLPSALGIAILRALSLGESAGRAPLPIIACFFAAMMAQYQSPLAVFFTVALTLMGLLYLASDAGRHGRHAFAGLCLVLALLGLTYQAGQPVSRGWEGMVAGRSKTIVAPLGLPRASLIVAADEAALYGLLVNLIQSDSDEDERLLTLPGNPELAFLSGRPAALAGQPSIEALNRATAFDTVARALAQDPPRMMIYRPSEWTNTPAIRQLAASLRSRYHLLETAGDFEVYIRKD